MFFAMVNFFEVNRKKYIWAYLGHNLKNGDTYASKSGVKQWKKWKKHLVNLTVSAYLHGAYFLKDPVHVDM